MSAKYKYLSYVPKPVNLDPATYDLVDDDEFCQVDSLMPLLITTQFGIFPKAHLYENQKYDYSIPEGLENQPIVGLIGRGYISYREREGIFELKIEHDTINRVRRKENSLICDFGIMRVNYVRKDRYLLKN